MHTFDIHHNDLLITISEWFHNKSRTHATANYVYIALMTGRWRWFGYTQSRRGTTGVMESVVIDRRMTDNQLDMYLFIINKHK